MLLTIDKLIYGGDGLAHMPADSSGRRKALFIPLVLAGEKIEAKVDEQKSGYARGFVEQIVEPSSRRVQPGCPYFAKCGGCHYQHTDYDKQLEIKKEILRETLQRTARIELPSDAQIHPSPPWNYRNRSRFQVKTSPEFAAGYFKMRSHELLGVEECPISSPLINRALASLWRSGRAGKVPSGVDEVEFFANAEDTQALAEISCTSGARRASVRSWAEELMAYMPEITGVVAFRDTDRGNRRTQKKLVGVGCDHLFYKTRSAAYKVSAGSFFQVNRHLTDELVRIVTAGQRGELAMDLYAGAGLFSTALACDFHHVISVESSQTSSSDLSYNLPSNGEVVRSTTEQYLAPVEQAGQAGLGTVTNTIPEPDLVVVDPPRSGLGERVARRLAVLGAPRVVYVSCDPATLARDLVVLLGAGYRIEKTHLVDLFPQTYHLETVVHLAR